jgi:hypothetical protein
MEVEDVGRFLARDLTAKFTQRDLGVELGTLRHKKSAPRVI